VACAQTAQVPLSALAALMLFATAMAFTPGPNTTLSAAITANRGLRPALRFVFAVPVGWGLMLLACIAGLGALHAAAPLSRGAIKAAGLAYMVWLAWRLAGSGALAQPRGGLDIDFAQGVALPLVNVTAWMNGLMSRCSRVPRSCCR
jgi:threonine/homoserine/homoserine lactone efflux protein